MLPSSAGCTAALLPGRQAEVFFERCMFWYQTTCRGISDGSNLKKNKESLHTYTGCHRRNVPDFGRVFLMLKYTDITQNTYVQSWTVTEIMAREVWNFDSRYTLIDYQIHIKTGRNVVSVMLISVLNIKLTCEWHKAIKLNYKNTRTTVVFVLRFPSNLRKPQLFVISPGSLHCDVS